jgi:hypothetical protein
MSASVHLLLRALITHFWRLLETAQPGWQEQARWLHQHTVKIYTTTTPVGCYRRSSAPRLPEGSPALVLPELTRSPSRSETESSIEPSTPSLPCS